MKSFSATVIILIGLVCVAQSQTPEPPKPAARWEVQGQNLKLLDASGAVVKEIVIKNEEKTISTHTEHGFVEKKFLRMKAGVSKDGRFAWVDRREANWLLSGNKGSNSFQYYGNNGELLWEKTTVMGSRLIDNGKRVALLEVDPKAIEILDQGNTFYRPRMYDSDGELIFDLSECKTYSDSIFLTKSERYGGATCIESEPQYVRFHLLFDLRRKIKKRVESPGVEVHEDGTYTTYDERQEFNPVTKKYGKFVRRTISHGQIE